MVAPISVCLIVRDEHGQLENCLKSIRPHVAELIVVDTGSEDNSVEIARKYADFVETYTECNDPATRTPENPNGLILRFDQARNRAFSHAKQPWVMWIDGDDEMVGAENLGSLVEEYDRARNGQPSLVMMPYEYSRDHAGNVNMVHERERLATPRQHFEWRGWVHEVLCPLGGDVRQHTNRVKIVHHRNAAHKKMEPGRNLRILRKQFEVCGDKDARHLYYLGMECGNNGLVDEAIKWLTLYMDKSGWDDERWQAAQLIANHYMNRGNYEKAIEWGFKAILIREDWGEGYFTVAKGCYFMAQRGNNAHRWWQRCVHYARMGLDKPPTATTLFVNPLERNFEIHRYYNLALSKIGDTKGAVESIKKALQVFPNDEQLNLNKRVFEEYDAVEEYKQKLNRLVELGKITKEVRDFLETTQRENRIPVPQGPQPVEPAKSSDDKLDIVFYVGRGVEAWNPETAKLHGIGGSETAVIEMGRRLAARGNRVRVFGDCSPRNGGKSLEYMFDGVQYLDVNKYKDLSCDVLITSRRPEAVDSHYNVKWKHSVLWVHDVHCGDSLNPDRAAKLDRIFALSDWHRQNILSKYTWLPPHKVQKTRNGIDLARFDQKQDRNPHRLVYSSSPDRGLDALFDIWPRLREQVSDAELHIYYGFQTWEACADDAQRLTITHLKNTIEKFRNQGVFYHGRVSQDELAREMLESGVWAYPTWFAETSCITAMEAQAAGLRMVTTPIAALNETVGDRGTMIPGDWKSADFQNRFLDAAVTALLKDGDADRLELQLYATEHFGWDDLAKDWDNLFNSTVKDEISLPEYQAVAQ
jgi:glycosyltransferase involved in cell wall biosynthesis